MYYEERVIDGVLHCKSSPDGDWRPISAEVLTAKIMELRRAQVPLVTAPQYVQQPTFSPLPTTVPQYPAPPWIVTCDLGTRASPAKEQ